ncbi:MAG: hypothetical protein RQ760_22250, partial [Sedimentisphaerales bacterium]|nr:hypothetical protein [Sedimentisphaerales bacterium]
MKTLPKQGIKAVRIMETTAKNKPNVEVASDQETLAHRSIELFVEGANRAIKAKGAFYVAISGG